MEKMSEKAKALPGVATPDRAKVNNLDREDLPTNIVPHNDNWSDRTAERIFQVLGSIYLKENNLEGRVVVMKRENA